MRLNYLIIIISILLFGCNEKSQIETAIQQVEVDITIKRFDKDFAAVNPSNLSELKKQYPVFFPKQFHDSIWINKISDTLQMELNREVAKKFPHNENLQDELHDLFQHIKYYFPTFRSPLVLTTTTDVDYQNKVIVADTLMVIGLDNYLGADHYFYEGIPAYISKNLKVSQLGPDVASSYARQLIQRPRKLNLISQMIYFGKELYLKDLWLPAAQENEKIGYSTTEYEWAQENEDEVWRYFIENELLFNNDPKLMARFINPAPFSKFYLEIDNDSPGMIGRYIGWQIVKSFMDKNNISIQELMLFDEETLYNKSKFKPKK